MCVWSGFWRENLSDGQATSRPIAMYICFGREIGELRMEKPAAKQPAFPTK